MQVAGTAVYIDDMLPLKGELYLGLVLRCLSFSPQPLNVSPSTRAHATLVRVDPGPALAMEGVEGWVDHTTLGEKRNSFHTAIRKDEVVFAEGEVHCQGQVIGGVVARDQDTAQVHLSLINWSPHSLDTHSFPKSTPLIFPTLQRAARAVVVEYEDLPAIVTMEQAIQAQSFYLWPDNVTLHAPSILQNILFFINFE